MRGHVAGLGLDLERGDSGRANWADWCVGGGLLTLSLRMPTLVLLPRRDWLATRAPCAVR